MKVLCEFSACAPAYVRSGWGRVFSALGHDFFFWDPSRKPALDIFSELEPDVFLGTTYGLDRPLIKALGRRPHVRVAMTASAWGPLADEVPPECPITRVQDQERANVAALFRASGRPHFVFSHVTDRNVNALLGGWKGIGVTPAGVLNAADTFVYCGGRRREDVACDVAFVGGYWGYKGRNLDRYLLPLCHPSSGLNVKVWGNQPWPVANYLGPIDDEDVRDVFASAAVCPNVSEPHSTEWNYDVVERVYKVPAAGGMLVSDRVGEIDEVLGKGVVPMGGTPEEFHELVRHYVRHPEERVSKVAAMRDVVLRHHTYFQRVAKMFGLLGLPDEAGEAVALHAKLVGPLTS